MSPLNDSLLLTLAEALSELKRITEYLERALDEVEAQRGEPDA